MNTELKRQIDALNNNRTLIANSKELMPEVKVNGVVTWDVAVTLDNEEIREMLLDAIDKKLAKLGREISDFKLSEDNMYDKYINDTVITEEAMEETEWEIRDRADLIDNLKYTWIPEARQGGRTNDLMLMEEDLKLLETYEDEFILSSTHTNAYLFQSEPNNQEKFKEVCERLIELSTTAEKN